jgi:hypothetical protein
MATAIFAQPANPFTTHQNHADGRRSTVFGWDGPRLSRSTGFLRGRHDKISRPNLYVIRITDKKPVEIEFSTRNDPRANNPSLREGLP